MSTASLTTDYTLCACTTLRQASRALTQLYDEAMRSSGLRSGQHALLRAIEIVGPVSISTLADIAVMDRTTLARNLDLLQRDGLVHIDQGEDARVREVRLTNAANRILAEAGPQWRRAQAVVAARLGPARLERLLEDVRALIATAQQA